MILYRTPEQKDRHLESMRREIRLPPARLAKASDSGSNFGRAIAFPVNVAATDWITKPLTHTAFGSFNPTVLQSTTADVYLIGGPDANGETRYHKSKIGQKIINPWPFAIDSNWSKNGNVFVVRSGKSTGPPRWIISGVQNLFIAGEGLATATATGETSGFFDLTGMNCTTVGELVPTGAYHQTIKFLGNALDLWCDVSFTANFSFDNSGGNPGTKTVVVSANGQTLVGGTIAVVPGQTTGSCSGQCMAQLSKDDEIRVVYSGSASLDTFGNLGGPVPAFCKLVIKPVLDF